MPSPRASLRSSFATLRGRRSLAFLLAALIVPVLVLSLAAAVAGPALDASGRIPVAVVNLDRGATDAKGRSVSYGDDLVDSLQQTGDLAWDVVDEDAADAGIADGTYALALKVPEDYSEKVASLSGDAPEKAVVEIVSDGSGNVLATRAGSSALRQVQSRLKSTLGEDYVLSVLNDVRGQATRLSLAADGSVMLGDGFDALKKGADSISTGLGQTAAASDQLTSGFDQIADGVTAAGTGAGALSQGIAAVRRQAVEPLSKGAGALADGLDQVAGTAQAMGRGMAGIGTALGTLRQTLAGANDDLAGLMGAGGEMAQQGEALGAASASLRESLAGAQGSLASLTGIGEQAAPRLQQAENDARALSTAISSGDDGSLASRVAALRSTLAGLVSARDRVADALAAGTGSAPAGDDGAAAGGAAEPGGDTDGALEALDAQIDALEGQIGELERQVDTGVEGSLAQRAVSTAASVGDASDSVSGAAGDAEDLKGLARDLETSGKAASDALAAMGQTMGGQQKAIANVAGALMGGQAILKGTDPVTGEGHDLSATATGLGHGVEALGAQLSDEGAVGKGVSGIANGTQALSAALSPMATGAGRLAQGNAALGMAFGAVAQGAGGLGSGLSAMADATGQLGTGVDQLKDASGKISETMGKAGETLTDASGAREDRAQVASNPVTFTSTSRNAVDGAAAIAAPVAIAAALWVGALLTSLVLPAVDMRAAMLGRGAASAAARAGSYMLLGLVQAALVALAALALGVQPRAAAASALLLALGAVSFAAIAQLLRLAFGRAAGAVSAVLLALQLLCAGAVLPTAFTGGVFSALGQVLPLSVLAGGLRSAIAGSGVGTGAVILVLVAWTVLALAASMLVAVRRGTVRPERLPVR